MNYSLQDFLTLSQEKVASIVKELGKPTTGIFVPNGNRRLVLTKTPYPSDKEQYLNNYINLLKPNTLANLQLFFQYRLRNLVIPLFSSSVLSRKGGFTDVFKEIIGFVFGESEYLELYKRFGVSIHIYGNLKLLKEKSLEESYDLVLACIDRTASYNECKLFFGIGSNDEVGSDLMERGIRFFEQNKRIPTLEEQKENYYSHNLPEADFLLVSSSLKAHAIPPLICGKHTNLYCLPSPGIVGLHEVTYRKILYDLLFQRNDVNLDFTSLNIHKQVVDNLSAQFEKEKNNVLGIGERIGPFWVIDGK